MDRQRVFKLVLVAVMTLASGLADASGFVFAAKIWRDGRFDRMALVRSSLGFAVGIAIYFVILRDLERLGVRAPEVQTLAWFGGTLIGVALFSRAFFSWRRVDQLVAVLVLMGIAWLMTKTNSA